MSFLSLPRSIAAVLVTAFPALAQDLTVRGAVVDERGGALAGALVTAFTGDAPPATVVADELGEFALPASAFGYVTYVLASAPDGRTQVAQSVRRAEVRALSRETLRLRLEPTLETRVEVRLGNEPAPDVRVYGFSTTPFPLASARTDARGMALLRSPRAQPLRQVWAWDPLRGAAMWSSERDLDDALELELMPAAPRTVRVSDPSGAPLEGVMVRPFFRFAADMDRFFPTAISDSWTRTDATGEAVFPWIPSEPVVRVFPDLVGDAWQQIASTEAEGDEPTEVVAIPRVRVRGRLVADDPARDLGGVLIEGRGRGPGRYSSLVSARTDAEGSFELWAVPGFAYALDVRDGEWASDGFASELADGFELPVRAAASLEVRVTLGEERRPVPGATLRLSAPREVAWLEEGETRTMTTGSDCLLNTGLDGIARFGLGPGTHRIRLSTPQWREERTITIEDAGPVTVEFHRARSGARKVRGRVSVQVSVQGAAVDMGGTTVAVFGLDGGNRNRAQTVADAEGLWELPIDADEIAVVARTADERFGAIARAGLDDALVALELQPVAGFAGTVIDPRGDALAEHEVVLELEDLDANKPPPDRAWRVQADGAFGFSSLIPNTEYRVIVNDATGRARRYVSSMVFGPDERLEDLLLEVDEPEPAELGPPPAFDFVRDLRSRTGDVKQAAMHTLVVVRASPADTELFVKWILDYDETPDVASFLPLSYTADAFEEGTTSRTALASHGLTLPPARHVLLAVFDGQGALLAQTTLSIDDEDRRAKALEFVQGSLPADVDARAVYTAALARAAREDKRVFVQLGGPRCGPCFRLGRWSTEHADLLDKDYVSVKIHAVRFLHGQELAHELRPERGGIPWYVILDASGEPLISSDGPFGNIGYPSRLQSIRHLRKMLRTTGKRLTDAEIDVLVGAFARE